MGQLWRKTYSSFAIQFVAYSHSCLPEWLCVFDWEKSQKSWDEGENTIHCRSRLILPEQL